MQLGPLVCWLPFLISGAVACHTVSATAGGAPDRTASTVGAASPMPAETAPGGSDTSAAARWGRDATERRARSTSVGTNPGHAGDGTPLTPAGHDRLAAFAAGCFWGIEDAYRHVPGVVATAVGYAGGKTPHPDYAAVCTHTTGHVETVLVEYDPTRIPYAQLLHVFWKIHDPTQVGGQGPDLGSNYRSVIFTFDEEQAAEARGSLQAEQNGLNRPITTEIRPMSAFYTAEPYHQQYAERTGHHGCPVRVPVDTL